MRERVGSAIARPSRFITFQPRSNSQHALTIQNLLTSRVWLPLLISAHLHWCMVVA